LLDEGQGQDHSDCVLTRSSLTKISLVALATIAGIMLATLSTAGASTTSPRAGTNAAVAPNCSDTAAYYDGVHRDPDATLFGIRSII
jgi:hypothetical protein